MELQGRLYISVFALYVSMLLAAGGCQRPQQVSALIPDNRLLEKQFDNPPKIRRGSYASPTTGTTFLDLDTLGPHCYRFERHEKNGIVYTCKAGHVDISHVREAADWTAYLAAVTYKHLNNSEPEFSFTLKEGSVCFIHLTYPDNWQNLSAEDRERAAFDLSVNLGRYFGYTAGSWHEILTWFGYKSKGVFPEFPSAFSWEDNFSNLLGCDIGVEALRDAECTFDEAVTYAIDKSLENLDVQSAETARSAAEKVRGLWFEGEVPPFVDMKRRNFDIGLDNGLITPWLIDSTCGCEGAKADSYSVPNTNFLAEYGFSMKLEIEPRVWEKDEILSLVCPDKKSRNKYIEPDKDFPAIMSEIKRDSQKRLLSARNYPTSITRRLHH
ncbi:MAG: DUF4056 domain-containing protein [Phycisphaerae bacterium]|nr:DUF4056 domain-containing protein [Phycisphaerae bacterium]MDD5380120.1 DUF4056 domain-containing protein [Phycisphaerae bacterium]